MGSMYGMAGGGGSAAAVTPSGLPLSALQIEDATLIGTDWWTQDSDTITAEIPIPASAATTLGGATGCPSFLVWPMGPIVGATGNLTVADIASLRMEMEMISLPSDNNVRIVLPFGVFASTATDPADVVFASDKGRWASMFSGGTVATPGTTAATAALANNNNPSQGSASLADTTRLTLSVGLIPRSTSYKTTWQAAAVNAASGPSTVNNSNSEDWTGTWNLFFFLGGGRNITTGDTVSPEFKLYAGALRRTTP